MLSCNIYRYRYTHIYVSIYVCLEKTYCENFCSPHVKCDKPNMNFLYHNFTIFQNSYKNLFLLLKTRLSNNKHRCSYSTFCDLKPTMEIDIVPTINMNWLGELARGPGIGG